MESLLQRRRAVAALAAGGLGCAGLVPAQAAEAKPVPLVLGANLTPAFNQKLMKLIAEAGGFEWQIQTVPWARALQLAERGQAVVFGAARNAQREALMDFSEPVYVNNVWLVARREQRLSFAKLEDLRGRKICVRRGTSYGDAFDAAKGSLFQVEQVDGDLHGRVRMLLNGRCEIVPGSHRSSNRVSFERRLQEGGSPLAQVEVLPVPLSTESIHFAVAKDQPLSAQISRINGAIRAQRQAIQNLIDEEG